jgi:hypothetical protein
MPRGHLGAVLAMSAWLAALPATAQTTRAEQIDQEKAAKAADVEPEVREKGDLIVTKLENFLAPPPPSVHITFGTFRPAAGLAAGLAYSAPVHERGLWTTSAAWSVNNFKQVESAIEIPPLETDRVRVRSFVKWDDAPRLPFYGLGLGTSPADKVNYGLTSTEAGVEVEGRSARWFAYGIGTSHLDTDAGDATASLSQVPGDGASPAWWHTTAYAAFDSRTSPGYTDSGALYRVAFHDYADRDGPYDFTRTEVDLRQFVPILHNNWIVALQARANFTATADGNVIPFFMLPTIGGRDTLPGYSDYRFTDRNSLLLRSELRWTPLPVMDMAVFLDQGTVAPTARGLAVHDLKRGWGIGARIHGQTFTALRLEVAYSGEGWRYNLAQNISF